MLWTPLVSGRRHVSHNIIEATTIFGGAFLFASCFINLVPHMYLQGFSTPNGFKIGAAVMIGFFIQLLLEQLTGGIEHGHNHHEHHEHCHFDEEGEESHTLKKKEQQALPLAGLLIGLCLHSFIEGMPLADVDGDIHQGLLYGIILHNIPIALVLISLFVADGIKPFKAVMLMLLFAVMTPLGSMLNLYCFSQDKVVQCLLMGVVVGILLHVSVSILFGENHNILTWKKLLLILVAFVCAYFTPGCPEIYF